MDSYSQFFLGPARGTRLESPFEPLHTRATLYVLQGHRAIGVICLQDFVALICAKNPMAQKGGVLSVELMNTAKLWAGLLLSITFSQVASAQVPFIFRMTLRGTCYQTNTTGQVIATPITEQSLLQDAAAAGGVDWKTLALVYHVQGSGFGDTIDVVNAATGQLETTLYGLFFGDNSVQELGRTSLTNSPGSEVRRLDYIYTSQNSHSMGACFTTKRFQADSNGKVRASFEGQMQWIVNPVGNAGTKVCTANFTTTKPFGSP